MVTLVGESWLGIEKHFVAFDRDLSQNGRFTTTSNSYRTKRRMLFETIEWSCTIKTTTILSGYFKWPGESKLMGGKPEGRLLDSKRIA